MSISYKTLTFAMYLNQTKFFEVQTYKIECNLNWTIKTLKNPRNNFHLLLIDNQIGAMRTSLVSFQRIYTTEACQRNLEYVLLKSAQFAGLTVNVAKN